MNPILPLTNPYPGTFKNADGDGLDEKPDRAKKSAAIKNRLGLPNKEDGVPYSPPADPAHFEMPGKALPEISLKAPDTPEFFQLHF